jgi:hypothetical protein
MNKKFNDNPGNNLYISFKNNTCDNLMQAFRSGLSDDDLWNIWNSLYEGLNDSLGAGFWRALDDNIINGCRTEHQ